MSLKINKKDGDTYAILKDGDSSPTIIQDVKPKDKKEDCDCGCDGQCEECECEKEGDE